MYYISPKLIIFWIDSSNSKLTVLFKKNYGVTLCIISETSVNTIYLLINLVRVRLIVYCVIKRENVTYLNVKLNGLEMH